MQKYAALQLSIWVIYGPIALINVFFAQQHVAGKKTKEQLEEEKKAYIKTRVRPCNVSGWDADRLREKTNELHAK